MVLASRRKNKVILGDYPYRRDIENRIHLAQLSVFDVEVLSEILCSSLSFPIANLVETLEAAPERIIGALNKLVATTLLTHDGVSVCVDKEMRKYYEFQIEKFEDDFAPDLEYIFRGLKRVPIHVLPNWYSIPRTTDDIFASIIEKYLATPKLYKQHLEELDFDDPVTLAILKDVFSAPDCKVRSKTLRDRYHLTREQFEEHMLLLEFNFACFLSYSKIGDEWKETVTPMREWRDYLRFQCDTRPASLPESDIEPFHRGGHFAFISDLTALVRILQEQALDMDPLRAMSAWIPALVSTKTHDVQGYLGLLVSRLLQLGLAEPHDGKIYPTNLCREWLKKQAPDQAMLLYRLPIRNEEFSGIKPEMFSEKNLRAVEKAIRRVATLGWVSFEAFQKGMCEPLSNADPVMLKQKGKRSRYELPTYRHEDIHFVKEMLFQRLFQIGIVSIGHYQGTPCFSVTPFGRIALGEA